MPSGTGARREKALARASAVVGQATEVSAEGFVMEWMRQNKSCVPRLVVYLQNGGFKDRADTKKVVGEMSRGTFSLSDVSKKYMAEQFAKWEPEFPKRYLDQLTKTRPDIIFLLWRIGQNLPLGAVKTIKVGDYYPRNYVTMAEVAERRSVFSVDAFDCSQSI